MLKQRRPYKRYVSILLEAEEVERYMHYCYAKRRHGPESYEDYKSLRKRLYWKEAERAKAILDLDMEYLTQELMDRVMDIDLFNFDAEKGENTVPLRVTLARLGLRDFYYRAKAIIEEFCHLYGIDPDEDEEPVEIFGKKL